MKDYDHKEKRGVTYERVRGTVMLTVTSKSYTPPDNMTVSPGAATWRAIVTEEYEQPTGHTSNTADQDVPP
jgi:hypothetical protein